MSGDELPMASTSDVRHESWLSAAAYSAMVPDRTLSDRSSYDSAGERLTCDWSGPASPAAQSASWRLGATYVHR
jgi:hypothetical protein